MAADTRERVLNGIRDASVPTATWPSATKLSRSIGVSRSLTLGHLIDMILDGTVERRPSDDPTLGWMERSASVFRWLETPLPPEAPTDDLLCRSCAHAVCHDWHRYTQVRSEEAERREDERDARCDSCKLLLDGRDDDET